MRRGILLVLDVLGILCAASPRLLQPTESGGGSGLDLDPDLDRSLLLLVLLDVDVASMRRGMLDVLDNDDDATRHPSWS